MTIATNAINCGVDVIEPNPVISNTRTGGVLVRNSQFARRQLKRGVLR